MGQIGLVAATGLPMARSLLNESWAGLSAPSIPYLANRSDAAQRISLFQPFGVLPS
jgi:hypothetical protein